MESTFELNLFAVFVFSNIHIVKVVVSKSYYLGVGLIVFITRQLDSLLFVFNALMTSFLVVRVPSSPCVYWAFPVEYRLKAELKRINSPFNVVSLAFHFLPCRLTAYIRDTLFKPVL